MFTGKKYIYEVYKEKSFSKAAQNLYISQPSLSARIKKTEEQIGVPLFDRSTSPLKLTEIGEVYIEAAKEIFQIEQRVENHINIIEQGLNTGKQTHAVRALCIESDNGDRSVGFVREAEAGTVFKERVIHFLSVPNGGYICGYALSSSC